MFGSGSAHWLDVLVFATLLGGLVLGALAGFTRIVLRFLHYSIAIAFSVACFRTTRGFLSSQSPGWRSVLSDAVTGVVLFLIAYFLVLICVSIVRNAFRRMRQRTDLTRPIDDGLTRAGLKPIDRLLGAATGAVLASVPLLLLVTALHFLAKTDELARVDLEGSICAPPAFAAIAEVESAIPQRVIDGMSATAGRARDWIVARLGETIGEKINEVRGEVDRKLDGSTPKTTRPGTKKLPAMRQLAF